MLHNQRLGKVIAKSEKVDLRFVHWLLRDQRYRAEVLGSATGSTVKHTSPGRIGAYRFHLPPLPEQRAIAATLGALDDKIELNRKMNATLEAMARALFRDWFVDFGPTRAKMEGLDPYLAPALWDLFPASLDDEDKPEGWTPSTIGEEVRVVGGSTPSTAEPAFWDGTLNWATPKDLSNLSTPVLLETSRKITKAGLGKISSGLLPVGTVLLSSRAPIGYLAIAEVPVAINQGFIAMICDKRLSNVFVWLWTLENMEAILSKANGSTFQEISKGNFRPLPVVLPDAATLAAFDAQAKPLYARIAQNERETRTLAQTRDLLLPRLMSGELRVAEVAPVLEAAQ
jgi:type I restriction enzyme S subunit